MASVALVALASAPVLHAQAFDLGGDREPLVSLDGPWRFHPGDSPAKPSGPSAPISFLWAAPDFDDTGWPLLRSDDSWSDQGYQGMSGFGWYRFSVHIPPGDYPASLMLAPILTAFEVYVDGQFVGKSGQMPPTILPNARISQQVFPLTQSGSNTDRKVTVAIRVWHSPMWASYVGGGPFMGGHLAGANNLMVIEQTHEQLARNVRFVDYYAYSIVAALIGLAILCLFIFRPAEREYLWFAVMLLS